MCLAIPGKIIGKDGQTGQIDFGGLIRTARLDLLPEAAVGDVILVHAGFGIQTVDLSVEPEIAERLGKAGVR
ncbi:HypC/HybG/HupF family hydrogenase formation chaperone [bacterium]|nr:HypC/HybG/HupF family hydrogenase formation chaperone [bacterium]